MSLESVADRRRKRIVEHVIMYFDDAQAAVIFGNTLSSIVNKEFDSPVKYAANIGAGDTVMSITEHYSGPTALMTMFLEVSGDAQAQHICKVVRRVVESHNQVHGDDIKVASEVIREKPQPQTVGFGPKRVVPGKPPFNLKLVR